MTDSEDLAVLRHELCSPLAAMTSLMGVLADDESDPSPIGVRRREIARLAYWQARHMSAVLNGTGGRARAVAEVVVAAVVAAGIPEWRLRSEVTPEAANTVVDAAPVQQVLTNLLGNAVRHGASHTEIGLTARRDGGSLWFAVHNRLAGPFRPRPAGRGLGIVDSIVTGVRGSFTMRIAADHVFAEATLPVVAPEMS